MQRDGASVLYSAKDLINFLGCAHSTALDWLCFGNGLAVPAEGDDAYLTLLKEKGNEHERRYLQTLHEKGDSVREIERVASLEAMADATRQAMRDGVDVIYQGALVSRPWFGYSDFLLKVDSPSRLGDYSYEVADTKLARSAKPKHVVQLCLYSELIAVEQELMPKTAHAVLGDETKVALRLNDYLYYCQAARERLLAFVSAVDRHTEAEPCEHCQMCRWTGRCQSTWEATDHLSLVARINRTQRRRLVAGGISTLAGLAGLPDDATVAKLQPNTLERVRSQARLQLTKRTTGENRVELLAAVPRRGFLRLPKPNEGDLFFDMEGDPIYAMDGSLEYLFGFHYIDAGQERFTPFWATDRASERRAFEDAVDFIAARLAEYPDAYIYHYASYEETALKKLAQKYGAASPETPNEAQTSALKRLAQQYGTRENEVDDLLRGRKLVDLYKVVREGIRVSEPSYSLKNLEVFFAPERTHEIKAGGDSIVAFERWLVLRDDTLLRQIEEYNAFDCRSTRLCRDWLVRLRPSDVAWFDPAAEGAEDTEKEREREAKRRSNDERILELRAALTHDVSETERGSRELIGHLLEYHRREARREWWDYFERLTDKSREQLIDDPECIGGLTVDRTVSPRPDKRSMVWTLRFPEQETKLRAGQTVVRVDTEERLEIVSLDDHLCCLELKLGPSRQPLADDIAVIPPGPRDDTVQREAIRRYAEAVVDGTAGDYAAVTSILRKDRPRMRNGDAILSGREDGLSGTVAALHRMDTTHIVVQGPPGSGKTFTCAHAIVDLLTKGKRVGVTALSHKAINNLLKKVEEIAKEREVQFRGIKKSSNDDDHPLNGSIIEDTDDNNVAIDRAYQLVAGTAWLFSRPDMDRTLDYLFVDEAGQMSLANIVATGVSACNIVLVGDQMQLSQPIKGAHPGGSGVSALDYLVGEWPTVPPDRGIFLARTWRMHPELCRFVSDAFYDGRLQAVDDTARQRLDIGSHGSVALAPYGLRFVSVAHEDNGQKSVEEAHGLNTAYRELLGKTWVNFDGETRVIGVDDILVVSPYNMQVNLLKDVLPDGARVGTVDKFQGQEATVVLISLAASSSEYIPRGIEFLFSRNRLNVAISRARCLSVVFASGQLLATGCRTIDQLRLVNGLCWANAFSSSPGTRPSSASHASQNERPDLAQ